MEKELSSLLGANFSESISDNIRMVLIELGVTVGDESAGQADLLAAAMASFEGDAVDRAAEVFGSQKHLIHVAVAEHFALMSKQAFVDSCEVHPTKKGTV